jgi:2-deoxystreptamine N-acetyl-D-glucosaminyltransferase / 2-deoxystreptamine glucosyltransferase
MSRWDAVQHPVIAHAERWAVRSSTTVTTLTAATAATVASRVRGAGAKTIVVPDVVDVDGFSAGATPEAQNNFRLRWALDPGRPVIVFVGRIAYEKGWRHVVPLAEGLAGKRVQVVIVGDGPERHLLDRMIAGSPTKDAYRVTGFVSNEYVAVAISVADVVVMPSLHEEFGGASIEALALRKPVVAFAVGGLKSVIGAFLPDLLVQPGNLAEFIRTTGSVLDGRVAPRKMELIANRIREMYHPNAVFPALLDKYHELVGTQGR